MRTPEDSIQQERAQRCNSYEYAVNTLSRNRTIRSTRSPIVVAIMILTVQPILTASGQQSGGDEHHADLGHPGRAAEVTRTIHLELSEFRFRPSKILVNKGETIRFWIHNTGKVMHELNIGAVIRHSQLWKRRDKNIYPKSQPMISTDPTKGMISNSISIEPREFAEFIWKFLGDTDAKFYCGQPGHYEAGMSGMVSIR